MKTSVVFVVLLGVVRTVHGACDRPTGRPNTELITDVTFPAPDGTSVTFTCEVGYRRVGSGTVACSAGTWSTLMMTCEIINCGLAGEVIHGHVDYSKGTEFGVSAHVVCNDGYRVVGFENNLYCGVNGWQGRLASCEVIMCDAPNQIANGYFSPMKDEYEHSEVITYSCKGEHTLNGSKTATCEENGQFHPAPPTCVLLRCPVPRVNNGVLAAGARPLYNYLSSVTFRCVVGHAMEGHDKVTCDINSNWSPALPKCNLIMCDAPNQIANGHFSPMKDEYEYSKVIQYSCEGEHILIGSKTATCEENGQFHPAPPTCVLVECPVPRVDNGVLAAGARPRYNYLSSVTFRCKVGYTMEGQDKVTCDINSNWSPALPKCNLIECRAPEIMNGVVVNGSRPTYKFKETITLRCRTGYELSGQSNLTCEAKDQWSDALPVCTLIMCDAPNQIANGHFSPMKDEYEYSKVIQYSCEGEHILIGSKTATCEENGQFHPAPPTCVFVKCPVPRVDNGVAAGGARPLYRHLSSVTFRCKVGYTMEGQDKVTCDINSNWSPALPKCNRIE